MRNKKQPALNVDLWIKLLELLKIHDVEFVWVKGHSDNEKNARCDKLATDFAKSLKQS
jgi:ribonuclease HI